MAFRFDLVKSNHIILFLLHSLGGIADIAQLFLLLYLADLRHLAQYGTLILGDSYIALKYGPAPFHLLGIIKQLQEGNPKDNAHFKALLNLVITEKKQISASGPYNPHHLADSEVGCMFDVIRQYKGLPLEGLSIVAKDKAWHSADVNGEISIYDMAEASGASSAMIAYITQSFNDELNSFDHK